MTDQAQCPNCGGYKVTLGAQTPMVGGYKPFGAGYDTGFIISAIAVTLVIFGFFAGLGYSIAKELGAVIGGIIGIVAAVAYWWNWLRTQKKGHPQFAGHIYQYACDICGYRWSWQPGTPLPAVTVHPDLIAAVPQPWVCGVCGYRNEAERAICACCTQISRPK